MAHPSYSTPRAVTLDGNEMLPETTRLLVPLLDKLYSHEALFPRHDETPFNLGVKVGKREVIDFLIERLRQQDSA